MKKRLILLMLVPCSLWAEDDVRGRLQLIQRTQSTYDPTLSQSEAIFEFQFESKAEVLVETDVFYTVDGSKQELQRTKNGIITLPSIAGKHIFTFFYDSHFMEIYSDSLTIEALKRDRYTISLLRNPPIVPCKPVIYLYPPLSTDVSVNIDINGEDTFLYPPYEDAWKFTAHPNGDLVFGNETYNYLFWEATNRTIQLPKQPKSGFFVEGQHIIPFFEDKLTQAGFTSKEQADFITYWGPTLAKNELNFIYFEFNEACEKYAKLEISPKPDHLYRIFMVWEAVEAEFPVTEQEIIAIDRTGFSVLEWGGLESHMLQIYAVK